MKNSPNNINLAQYHSIFNRTLNVASSDASNTLSGLENIEDIH